MSYIDPTDPKRFDKAIDFLARTGGHATAYIPIIEAVRAGAINLQFATDRNASLPFGRIRRSDKPVMILLSEDDYQPGGPALWRVANQVTRWCSGALINGAGAERHFYEKAVQGTLVCQRFLVIDTASKYVADWAALLGHVHSLIIWPREGVHPIAPRAENLH